MNGCTVRVGGLLGEAIAASRRGRLSRFIVDETSPAVQLFAPAQRDAHTAGDWYGEHAGKWLQAAARAAAHDGDAALRERVRRVARFLVAQQQPDGYLGTYAASHRFMQPAPPAPALRAWDGAPSRRTWDLWVHACLLLGLLEVHRHWPDEALRAAACRIGDLCDRVLRTGDPGRPPIDVLTLGNHHGLSATVLLDAIAQLHADIGQPHHLALAEHLASRIDALPEPALLQRLGAGADASEIATGKAYQLLWNAVGLAKLQRLTGRADLLAALQALWRNVHEHHLTLGGGPWGGVAHRSREVFNARGTFSPHGYVETCSTMAWILLNRELLAITGAAVHADAIEQSLWNDLLGAMAPDGEGWCYYVFPNGRRAHTTAWRCCKSSGAMALEEIAPLVATLDERDDGDVLSWHLHGPATVRAGDAVIEQRGRYPFDGRLTFHVHAASAARPLHLRLRVPAWTDGATLDGEPCSAGGYVEVARPLRVGDEVRLVLPMLPRLHRRSQRNVQESVAPDGAPVRQEVLRQDWAALTRGPLVYATGLVDGYKTGETVLLPESGDPIETLACEGGAGGDGAPTLRLHPLRRAPIDFVPYYRAGSRTHGAWRLTWLALAPDAAAPWTEEGSP